MYKRRMLHQLSCDECGKLIKRFYPVSDTLAKREFLEYCEKNGWAVCSNGKTYCPAHNNNMVDD